MDKQQYDKDKKFIADLRKVFDPAVVKVETKHSNGVLLTFVQSGYSVVISPREALDPYYAFAATHFDNLTLIYDKNYQVLSGIIQKNPFVETNKDPADLLLALYLNFKKRPKPKFVNKLPYRLRKESEKLNKLSLTADREYFFYGDDELAARYRESRGKVKLKKNQKVKIIDESALLFTLTDGTRIIDLHTGTKFLDKNYLYLDEHIVEYKEVQEGEDHDLVSLGESPSAKRYLKATLKADVDLAKLTNKIPYTKANNKEFTLVKKGELYSLEDKEGLIAISHPDLLVYLL